MTSLVTLGEDVVDPGIHRHSIVPISAGPTSARCAHMSQQVSVIRDKETRSDASRRACRQAVLVGSWLRSPDFLPYSISGAPRPAQYAYAWKTIASRAIVVRPRLTEVP